MNRILSWKIKSGVYAYIHIPNSTSHISKRIPENSPLWDEIISVISSWEKDEYKSNFQEMALEIRQRYGKSIEWDDKYWDFVDENSFGGVNIVMLAGQEGDGYSGGGNSASGGDNDTDGDGVDDNIADAFAQFDAMIDAELAAMRAAVDEKNNAVKAQIEASVQNTVAEAKKEIAETQAELEATNKRLTEDLSSAKDAMEKASALFELGEGNITAEDIQGVISNVNDYSKWVTDLSGNVVDLKSDYDSTVSALTSMGVVEDIKHGLFSHFATTINTTASATGHVERWMASISGVVQDMAKWYTDDSVTEAIRFVNASSGIIQDTINFVHGDDTNSLNRMMDAKNALILDEAKSYVQDVSGNITTSVYEKMDGLRGEIEESITKAKEDINGNQESIISLGERMDATDESIEQWITKTEELSGTAKDLRDRWDTVSGMVRSVSDMVVRTDENGNQLGYIEINGANRDVVKLGQAWYLMDTNEPVDSKEVVPYYSYSIGSYISQTANEAIMSVVDDTGKTAAIRAAISGDTALIGLVADKVVMDADVVMRALSAKTASIGGIQIGKGKISAVRDYDQYGHEFGVPDAFVLDGITGGFSATNAYIEGKIKATEGELEKVVIKGSTRSPFVEPGTIIDAENNYYVKVSDNYISSDFVNKDTGRQIITLPTEVDEADGRRITLVGNFYIQTLAPTTFYENGRESSSLNVFFEVVELLGFSVPSTVTYGERVFKGWIVLSRQRINGNYPYGKNLSAMALGSFKSNGTLKSKTFDESELSGKRTGTGIYQISIPKEWCSSLDKLIVSCSIVHNSGGFSAISIVARKDAENNLIHFGTYNGTGGPCDSDFEFIIYNMNIWN